MRRVTNLAKSPFPMPDVVTKGIPAPTDGLDAISPLADMDPKRAPILTNFVARPGWVELRQGFSAYVQSMPGMGPVETLMVYRAPTVQKMYAATHSAIFDVSTAGLQTQVVGSLSSNRWQYTNFTSGGQVHVIQLVNGSDPLQQFDGTNWTVPSITGFPNSWTTANIVNIIATKQRLWYVMANSTIVAFMPTGNITGAIAGFQDFGTLFDKGGFVVTVFEWTIDGGEGPNSYVGFMSSEGQVALYQGFDPTNTNAWSLVGVFTLSKPVGFRCATRIGSDVALITYQGLLQVSQALPYDPSADRSAALTARIQNAMNQAVQLYANNFGWQYITYPLQTIGILNVPTSQNNTSIQYVMNMLTGAWSQFTNWNANCFEIYNQNLYFGDSLGNVNQAYTGAADLVASIPSDMQCAFNWFDDPGRLKRITMVQPLMTASGGITPALGINVDFASTAPLSSTQSLSGGSVWDSTTSTWDFSTWSTGLVQVTSWLSAEAVGKALAIRLQANVLPGGTGPTSVFDKATFDSSVFDGVSGQTITLQVNAFNAIMELGGFI